MHETVKWRYAFQETSAGQWELTFLLGSGEAAEFAERLGAALGEGREYSLTLEPLADGNAWRLFWKRRPGSVSRLLAAHPETDRWVATVSVSLEMEERLLSRLSALVPGSEFSLADLGPVDRLGNLVLKFKVE